MFFDRRHQQKFFGCGVAGGDAAQGGERGAGNGRGDAVDAHGGHENAAVRERDGGGRRRSSGPNGELRREEGAAASVMT
jgi:hypothetical protein